MLKSTVRDDHVLNIKAGPLLTYDVYPPNKHAEPAFSLKEDQSLKGNVKIQTNTSSPPWEGLINP